MKTYWNQSQEIIQDILILSYSKFTPKYYEIFSLYYNTVPHAKAY